MLKKLNYLLQTLQRLTSSQPSLGSRSTLLLLLLTTFLTSHATPVIKNGPNVFEKWVTKQTILTDRSPTEMAALLNDHYLTQFRAYYESNFALLKPLTGFLNRLTAEQINQHGYRFESILPAPMTSTLTSLYDQLEHNQQAFVNTLKHLQFSSPMINHIEESCKYDFTVEKYKMLSRLLFKQENRFKEDEFLLGMANRIFEYCFQEVSFPHYQALLNNQSDYPLVRFLHSTLWYNLVGSNWLNWHKNSLELIEQSADAGNRIMYPAGGTDVYMLLQNGVYNITIVDPFLPTQKDYYTEGWDWLVRSNTQDGGINDEINFNPPYRHLTLKRTAFTEGDSFYAKLSTGDAVMIKKSTTTWTVLDGSTNATLGSIIIDRRFTNQHDFTVKNNPIVMSYDELVCAISPEMLSGWGIDPDLIHDDQVIIVKQLRKPVPKKILQNLRIAIAMNAVNMKFISFASDPT